MLLSIDMEKCFDRLEHKALFGLLRYFLISVKILCAGLKYSTIGSPYVHKILVSSPISGLKDGESCKAVHSHQDYTYLLQR